MILFSPLFPKHESIVVLTNHKHHRETVSNSRRRRKLSLRYRATFAINARLRKFHRDSLACIVNRVRNTLENLQFLLTAIDTNLFTSDFIFQQFLVHNSPFHSYSFLCLILTWPSMYVYCGFCVVFNFSFNQPFLFYHLAR